MQKAQCPSGGAEVTIISQASVFTVCPYCSSSLYRENMDLRLLGQMAALQDDPTVFQIGTTGIYGNEQFTMIGRVRQKWSGGAWNEWYIYFGSDKYVWLAESQGFLMVSFNAGGSLPEPQTLEAGSNTILDGVSYEVTDIKNVLCGYAEGELPMVAKQGDPFVSVDLVRGRSQFASISYFQGGAQLYLGEYLDFESFKFKNLREIDGW